MITVIDLLLVMIDNLPRPRLPSRIHFIHCILVFSIATVTYNWRNTDLNPSEYVEEATFPIQTPRNLLEDAMPRSVPLRYPRLNTSTDSTRLLILHPGRGEQRIRCDIHTTTFAQTPSYEALSYAWGESRDTRAIIINGVLVDIRVNL